MNSQLLNTTLHLADNSLIMGHRLSEWTGHGPMLEQDIAMSNIALDHIGQTRNLYQYAALLKGNGTTEDDLAYLRDPAAFKNIILVELPNGDWGFTIMKLFLFSAYQYFLYKKMIDSSDEQLSAIAEKSLKEVTYHVRWSSEWVIRLGDGTAESKQRVQTSLNELWKYADEMFQPADYENESKGITGIDPEFLKKQWLEKIKDVITEATLILPDSWSPVSGGKTGRHSEHLISLLSEMQYLQRTYPGCEW